MFLVKLFGYPTGLGALIARNGKQLSDLKLYDGGVCGSLYCFIIAFDMVLPSYH